MPSKTCSFSSLLVMDEDRRPRQEVAELAGGAYPVHLRHVDVHQHHVGLLFAAERQGFLAVVDPADRLHAGQLVHDARQPLGEETLIVDYQHPDDVFGAQGSTLLPRSARLVGVALGYALTLTTVQVGPTVGQTGSPRPAGRGSAPTTLRSSLTRAAFSWGI